MSRERNKVLIVEDREEERRSVINYLQRFRVCVAATLLPPAGTYAEACELLEKHGAELKLVSLDLNIPLDEQDGSADNSNGGKILERIHELNNRSDHQIRVIVVSGQEIAKGWNASNLMDRFGETLVGVARKDEMPRSFVDQLRKLDENPTRNALVDLKLDVVDHYDVVFDSQQRIKERLKSARSLAIQLLRNELDVFADNVGEGEALGDDLAALISRLTERFAEKTARRRDGTEFKKRFIEAASIEKGGWESFLWRGSLLQHLYCLNNYRNDYEHIDDKPFHSIGGRKDAWEIPSNTLRSLERGERLGQILELMIGDLLDWYLPWHEQVYLPWKNSGGRSS
jgi:CheY-like chemotaxis protein